MRSIVGRLVLGIVICRSSLRRGSASNRPWTMPAATLPILVNILVAGMFVAGFLTIAHLNPGFRHIRWIAASYALGMLTPLAEFLLPLFSWPAPFMVASYAGLFIGMVVMSPALSLLYGKRPMWSLAVAFAVAGLVARGLVWEGQRNDFFFELAYQIPFAAAASLCSATIAVHGRGTGLDRAAMALFAVIGAHFLLKPFAAVYLGSGATMDRRSSVPRPGRSGWPDNSLRHADGHEGSGSDRGSIPTTTRREAR